MRAALPVACALGLFGCANATELVLDAARAEAGPASSEAGPTDASPIDVGSPPAGGRCAPQAVPPSGFVANEVYVESTSPDCGGGPCVVFHLVGIPACMAGTCLACGGSADCGWSCDGQCVLDTAGVEPNSRARTFCSCRCGPGGDEALPLCSCPGQMRCVPDTDPGGGYCVPDALAVDEGICLIDAECSAGQRCGASHHCR